MKKMSDLSKLIQQLCPNGVVYKKLGDIATITRGGNFQKKDYVEQGFPCIHYGQIYTKYNLFVTETISRISNEKAEQQKKADPGDIIMAVTSENIEDVCKCIAWLGNSKVAVSGHAVIIHHNLNPKFLTYFLSSSLFYKQKLSMVQGTKVIEVSPEKLKKTILPVPPLEVQQEIVRILDQFAELTTELTTELTAELTARKQQYIYYRNFLLSHQNQSTWMTLGDIGKVAMCKRIMKAETSPSGDVPFYKIGTFGKEPDAYISKEKYEEYRSKYSFPKKGDVLISAAGTIGRTVIYDGQPAYYQDSNIVWVENDESIVLNRYLYYYYQLQPWAVSTGGTIARLYNDNISKAKIPLPPLPEQRRIVAILDRFDALCNDLTSGLPAEIAARQKQYEYYRDKLLNFKEKK